MVWLRETKIWQKGNTILYGDKKFHCLKTDNVYKDIVVDVETRFNTSNYELDRSLPKGKSKKVIGSMKDKIGGKFVKEFVLLKEKTYSYLKGNNGEDKKAKGTNNCVKK